MDTKALAKSKRAHSLHHSKKHSHHKEPSTSFGSKNPTGKQTGVNHSRGSKELPSNYDRYDEDVHLDSQESTRKPSEFVVRKSRGADYAYLLSEATAQSQAIYSSDGFLLFNDGLEDFTRGFGPLLAAKGQSIMSWITDDNFDFEDRASTSQEASFLSLDLSDLAVQLAKAKPSERLFIEPDLLPPELLDDELQARNDEHDQVNTCTPAVTLDSGASSLDHEPISGSICSITISEENPILLSRDMKQTKDEISEFQETVNILPNSSSTHNANSASGSVPIFEAASAEAELDMLLNSFSETEFLQSSSSSTSRTFSTAAATTESAKKEHPMASYNIDDTIDNLLEETSDATTFDLLLSSHPSSKPKLLDDFDSWLDTI